MNSQKVFIADTDRTSASLLALRFQQLRLKVRVTVDGSQAMPIIREFGPDLIILGDVDLATETGRSVAEAVLGDSQLEATPMMVISDRADRQTITRCQNLGITYFHRSSTSWDRLQPIICEQLAFTPTTRTIQHKAPTLKVYGKVLCVDEDPKVTRRMQVDLREYGIDVIREKNGTDGFKAVVDHRPQVIVTEFSMREGLGSYMLGRMRDCEIDIPVIFVTGVDESNYINIRQHLMDLGASAVMNKPIEIETLIAEIRQHIHLPAEVFADQQPVDAELPAKDRSHENAPHIPIGGSRPHSKTPHVLRRPSAARHRLRHD